MNSSKTNEILKDIKTNTANITSNETGSGTTTSNTLRVVSALDDTNWATSNTHNSNISSTLFSSLTELTSIDSHTSNIQTELETINEKLVDIGITLSKDENKIWFHSRLDYNGNEYLLRDDYTSTPVTGYYENATSKPQYITDYHFVYESVSEPNSAETYHSPAFDGKIGKMTSNNDFIEPYLSYQSNRDMAECMIKQEGFEDITYIWKYDFSDAPIELGVSQRFGHLINGDMSSTYYDSWIYTYVHGYYYNN